MLVLVLGALFGAASLLETQAEHSPSARLASRSTIKAADLGSEWRQGRSSVTGPGLGLFHHPSARPCVNRLDAAAGGSTVADATSELISTQGLRVTESTFVMRSDRQARRVMDILISAAFEACLRDSAAHSLDGDRRHPEVSAEVYRRPTSDGSLSYTVSITATTAAAPGRVVRLFNELVILTRGRVNVWLEFTSSGHAVLESQQQRVVSVATEHLGAGEL